MAKELTESRRTRYTRKAMQDALIDLMRERPLGSITIKALCEQADVNRSTFYAHYDSIEELLHDIEDETMAWVTTALDQLLMQPAYLMASFKFYSIPDNSSAIEGISKNSVNAAPLEEFSTFCPVPEIIATPGNSCLI